MPRKFSTIHLHALVGAFNRNPYAHHSSHPLATVAVERWKEEVKKYFLQNKDTVYLFAITSTQRQQLKQVMTQLGFEKNIKKLNKDPHRNPNTGRNIYMYALDLQEEPVDAQS